MNQTHALAKRPVTSIRWIARIWSIVIIGGTLMMIIGFAVTPEPIEEDYHAGGNLMLLTLFLSVLGLGIAWRWEGLGGAINIGFFLAYLGVYSVIYRRFLRGKRFGSFHQSSFLGFCSWCVGCYRVMGKAASTN